MLQTIIVEGITNGTDTAIHHVGRGDNINPGVGLCQRLFAQNVDGFVIQDARVLIENAVMTMGGERVEGDIADHADIGHLTLQLARRTAGEAVGIVGFTAIGAAQIRWCDREQGNRSEMLRRAVRGDQRSRSQSRDNDAPEEK